jgi:hypothetical protein
VPAELRGQVPESYETLADLDETVWLHIPATTCVVLAERVLRQVQWSLARSWEAVRRKTLPKFHQSTPVSLLEVDVRTSNCLDNCMGLRVEGNLQCLNHLTVVDLLTLRNLGSCSLVDLLVALETVAAKSDRSQDRQLRGENVVNSDAIPAAELPSKFRVEISRFPRRGERIAPRTLSHILNVRTRSRQLGDVKLRDLDESAWERFESETCHRFVLEVVDRVRRFRGILCGQLGNRRLPIPRTKGRPALLHLQTRTVRCLSEAGLLAEPARLAETTFRELFEIPGFGDTSLVDLVCALETQTAIAHRTREREFFAAHRLAETQRVESTSAGRPPTEARISHSDSLETTDQAGELIAYRGCAGRCLTRFAF